MLLVIDTAFYFLLLLLLATAGILAWDARAIRREKARMKDLLKNVLTTIHRHDRRGDWPKVL